MDTTSALIFVSLAVILYCEIWCSALPANQSNIAHTARSQTRRRTSEDDEDPEFPTYTSHKQMKTNFSAAGKGYDCFEGICKEARDYPEEYMLKVIKEAKLQKVSNDPQGVVVYKENRFNAPEDPDYSPLCISKKESLIPKTMRNEAKQEKFIYNVGELRQNVLTESCVYPQNNKSCQTVLFGKEYEAICVQKYATVRLLTFNPDNPDEPIHDNFVIPSCCVCQYHKKQNKK